MNKYDALRKWVEARENAGLDQMDVARFFGVSQPLVSFWENGKNPPREARHRERMIEFLLYDENEHGETVTNEALKGLKLKQDSQTFHEIWDTVMVNAWKWRALTDEEKERFNLDPALGLYFNVPSRPLNIKRVVGRESLMLDLKERLLSDKRMALTGKPGVGKTMLAIELARDSEMMAQFPDGIIWVRMGRQPTSMNELRKIADALGINIQEDKRINERKLSEAIRNGIKRRHLLFVIDDVWPSGYDDVEHYFTFDAPNCRTILTTRDQRVANRLAGKSNTVTVPELDYKSEENPAYALLHDIAPTACNTDPDVAQHLVTLVGGLPLALVVIGGYLSAPERSNFSALQKEALTDMQDPKNRLQEVTKRLGDMDKQERTLQAIIELSVEDLSQKYKDVFHALGAFASRPERFDQQAAMAVTRTDLLTLNSLIIRNLLEKDSDEQLALHQVIADVARTDTPHEAITRHRKYYSAIVAEDRRDWQKIEKVYGQIKWMIKNMPEDEELIDVSQALYDFFFTRGLWHDGIELLNQAIRIGKEKQIPIRRMAELKNILGTLYESSRERTIATDLYKESARMAYEAGEVELAHTILNNLANQYKQFGWHQNKAIKIFKANLKYYRATNNHEMEALTLLNLAGMYQHLNKYDRAIKLYKEALPIAQELGKDNIVSSTQHNLGIIYDEQGRIEEATQMFEMALDSLQEQGNLYVQASELNSLGLVYKKQGRLSEALKMYEESLLIRQTIGSGALQANNTIEIGLIYLEQGRLLEAVNKFKQALDIAYTYGNLMCIMAALNHLGDVHAKLEDYHNAITYYIKLLDLQQNIGNLWQSKKNNLVNTPSDLWGVKVIEAKNTRWAVVSVKCFL